MTVRLKLLSTTSLLLTFSSLLCAAPRLGLSTNSVGSVIIQTGSNGPTQTVQAYNLGDGSLTLTVTSSASWLSATVGSQTACSQASGGCYPISIALNTASLAGGRYTEYLTVASANAIDAPQVISVTADTTGVPNSITAWLTPAGGGAATNTFPIYTLGTGIQGTVTTQGGNWLQLINGVTSIVPLQAPWLIAVNALASMSPGSYTGSVKFTGSSVASDNKTINVTVNVTNSPIISPNANATVQLTGYAGGPAATGTVSLVNESSASALNVTATASSASFITATVSGSNIQISADPGSMAAGFYTGTVTLTSNAANNAQISIPVEFTVLPAGIPSITAGGIVNAATYTPESFAPGDVVAVFGLQFAPSGTAAVNASTPLATTLASTQVLVNGAPVPLYFVSPGQINFQVPYSLTPGQLATVQVMANGKASNIRSMGVTAVAPRVLFFLSFITGNYGVIVNNTDGSLTLPTGTVVPGYNCHPAKPGDVLTVYGIGFGQTSPAAVEGAAASGTQLENVSNVTVTMGGEFSGVYAMNAPLFAGLTPTAVGLYQVNVAVPSVSSFGNAVPTTILVNGQQSNTVYLAISANGK